jgi:hypothetical protein
MASKQMQLRTPSAQMQPRAALLARPGPAPRSRVAAHAAATGSATLIDGKEVAATIRKEIKAEVEVMQAKHGLTPGLAVVLVGTRKDSQAYVNSKKKACEEVGFESFGTDLKEDATEEEVLKVRERVLVGKKSNSACMQSTGRLHPR